MSDRVERAESKFGENVLGKLKLVGGKIADGSKLVGSSLVDGSKLVGGKIVDAKTSLFESDLEKIRHLSQVQKQSVVKGRYTEEQMAALEARADGIIDALPPGYFDKAFDPVAHELQQLGDGDAQEEIDAITERLTLGVETVSGKLARHVNKKRDKLLEGVDLVAGVEQGIKSAFLTVRSSRTSVKQAAEEVQRNLRVAGHTRRKQGYIELMQVLVKIQAVRGLQRSLKRAQELGEYQEAISLCMQCFKNVESLSHLSVAEDLRATVQRQYVDTLRRMDTALSYICSEFDPAKFIKILEGYTLQGLDGRALGEKVVQAFKDSIQDVTTRVVRALLLTKPKLADRLAASSALEASYGELCRSLPVDMLRPALTKLMEVMFDVLASYHSMARWHVLAVAKQAEKMEEESQRGVDPAKAAADATLADYLTSVKAALGWGRGEVAEAAARRIRDLLTLEQLFKGEDFLQMTDWCQKFVSVCETFVAASPAPPPPPPPKTSEGGAEEPPSPGGSERAAAAAAAGGSPQTPPQAPAASAAPGPGSHELRQAVMAACGRFLPAYHGSNLESLSVSLNNEQWQDVGMATGVAVQVGVLVTALQGGESSDPRDFDGWVSQGNPFKRGALILGGVKPGEPGIDTSNPFTGAAAAAASASASQQAQTGSRSSLEAAAKDKEAREKAAASGKDVTVVMTSTTKLTLQTATLTISSQLALKFIKHYAQCLKPLHPYSNFILAALAEIFDMYLLAIFFMFGGMSLEDLCWRDDLITPRLRSALLRILSSEGSRYRLQVEELLRHKPTGRGAPIAATGVALLDRFGDKMESLAGKLERSVNRLAMTGIMGGESSSQSLSGPSGPMGSGNSFVGGMPSPMGGGGGQRPTSMSAGGGQPFPPGAHPQQPQQMQQQGHPGQGPHPGPPGQQQMRPQGPPGQPHPGQGQPQPGQQQMRPQGPPGQPGQQQHMQQGPPGGHPQQQQGQQQVRPIGQPGPPGGLQQGHSPGQGPPRPMGPPGQPGQGPPHAQQQQHPQQQGLGQPGQHPQQQGQQQQQRPQGQPGQGQPPHPQQQQQQQQQQQGQGQHPQQQQQQQQQQQGQGQQPHPQQSQPQQAAQQQPVVPPTRSIGLQERMVAVESLVHMAQELRAAKPLLMAQLPAVVRGEAEVFFRGSVEAAGDLKDCLFLSAARMLMGGAWDLEKGGVPGAIASTKYDVKDLPDRHNTWVDAAGLTFGRFSDVLSGAALSQGLLLEMWAYGLRVVSDGLLDGLAQVRRCSLEGRTAMSYDLNMLEKQIRQLAPPTFRTSLATVHGYVQAFYLTWEELAKWCQAHMEEYGRQRLFTLVEVTAEFNKVKRQQKNELLELLEAVAQAKGVL